MSGRTITTSDFYVLTGLAALLDENMREQEKLKQAVAKVVGEDCDEHGFFGYVDDWTYATGKRDVHDLLSNMSIGVSDEVVIAPEVAGRIEKP